MSRVDQVTIPKDCTNEQAVIARQQAKINEMRESIQTLTAMVEEMQEKQQIGNGARRSNMTVPNELQVLTVPEVADILRIRKSLAYRLCSTGVIPSRRLGKRLVVTRISLEQFLQQPEQPPCDKD